MEKKILSRLLTQKRNLLVIGAHDGMGGVLGEQAGFDAIWASGFEISAAHGLPDANILGMAEQLAASRQISDAVSIPVIADCDNGYGNAVNVAVQLARLGHDAFYFGAVGPDSDGRRTKDALAENGVSLAVDAIASRRGRSLSTIARRTVWRAA